MSCERPVDCVASRHDGPVPLRVAYTLEQCWHAVPGGTASAVLDVARRLIDHPDIELVGVAGRHRHPPPAAFAPPSPPALLPLARPWLYETWNRLGWPRVEVATGPVDVCHSTTAIPAATAAPHVVTVHDLAFLRTPERFTRHGVRVMRAGLERCRRADLVLCPSRATMSDLVDHRFDESRIRVVPWGVVTADVGDVDRDRVRRRHDLPDAFVLFVGTVEPRKNLPALAAANRTTEAGLPLVVAGAEGWGSERTRAAGARFLGFVDPADLPALYSLATVFAYPSLQEGFGLPVAEAMAYGTPVVTSRGTSTEEVAGGAAVLVDPGDAESIAAGIDEAVARDAELVAAGLARAEQLSLDVTVNGIVDAYRAVVG